MKYEIVMGLEVHVELSTNSKLLCSCSAHFGAKANENLCPGCSAMPGVPALINKRAIELGIAAAIVTNSRISETVTFDKKSYYYPDLPSGYQTTQLFSPICRDGWVEIQTPEGKKKITLKQIHIEADAGKLVHDYRTASSLVDLNRASVPLIEIVSNPDFSNAQQVVEYLSRLRSLLSFAGISDCKMQEGSMRCDVNISVRPAGSDVLGTRAEVKNMNSLKAIADVIEYEAQRHIQALEGSGEKLVQETRGWDEARGETYSMREKEDATDYRYFPDPEILPIHISGDWIERVRRQLGATAQEKYEYMTEKLQLSDYDSKLITASKNLCDIFDAALEHFSNPKEIANWIIVELLSVAKGNNKGEDDIKINCKSFAKLIELVYDKTINRSVGKKLLLKVLSDDIDPEEYVRENKLGMVSDNTLICAAVREAMAENEKSVEEYKNGNQKVIGFFVGIVMKKTGGSADPVLIKQTLTEELEKAVK